MMSSAAERARQKAEARRLRILSKSADRLGVVSGIVAPSILKEVDGGVVLDNASPANTSSNTTTMANETSAGAAVINSSSVPESLQANNYKNNEDDRDEKSTSSREKDSSGIVVSAATDDVATENNNLEAIEASRGARRMAAMRRRRYLHSKNKVVMEEEEELEEDFVDKVDASANLLLGGGDSTAPLLDNNTLSNNINSGTKEIDEPIILNEPRLVNDEDININKPPPIDEKIKKEEADDDDEEEDNHQQLNHPKKYMGVARIRRQKVKEQKAQRLKDISDADILGASSSPSRSSGVDLVREISAEVATMDITASMVRKGGVVLADENIGKWWSASSSARAPTKGFLGWNNSKRRSWKWYTSLVLPPMKLVPRLITLLLLFFAGMDLGTQPYRSSSFSDFSYMTGTSGGGTTGGSSLIGQVELSLTKPWEYGMGGKVAYMVGVTTTSPPTALPTHFLAASSEDEDDEGTDIMECEAPNEAECVAALTNNGEDKKKNKSKIAIKKKTKNIQLQLMEDEFDSTRTFPRGVVNHHHSLASEFDDNEYDPSASINRNENNIDPLFQVDLDAILHNAHLPLPIDYAAKFAIGFHRTWVHYLWKLPTSLVRWIIGIPINMMSGWIANPPWILGVVLLIRFITKVLVGSTSSSGKSFSLSENDDAVGNNSGMLGGGGGGGNLDVLEKIMGAAKNYASSSFPKTSFVFGTLMQVMKVDMYVLLCGLMIGLVMCPINEGSSIWMDGSDREEAHGELGNGEL